MKSTEARADERNFKIECVNDLINELRSNRAPRGKAALRNDMMREARDLQSELSHRMILSLGNPDSTYNGDYPETIGVALRETEDSIYDLIQRVLRHNILPEYYQNAAKRPDEKVKEKAGNGCLPLQGDKRRSPTVKLKQPQTVEPQIKKLPPLSASALEIKITRELSDLFKQYIDGCQTLTDLVAVLKRRGITVRSIGMPHRGCTTINPKGNASLLIVEDKTGRYSSVIV